MFDNKKKRWATCWCMLLLLCVRARVKDIIIEMNVRHLCYIITLGMASMVMSFVIYGASVYLENMYYSKYIQSMPVDHIPICERKYCPRSTPQHRTVLFGIKSPATRAASKRRNIIRDTFVKQILEYGPEQASYTFYLSQPPTADDALAIQNEIAEHGGDIITLPSLPETPETATTIKTLEFLRNITLAQRRITPKYHEYDWICHVDDDSYVQVYRLMENYLFNRQYPPFKTIIARMRVEEKGLDGSGPFMYPGGQMYCLSWDIAKLYARYFYDILPQYDRDHPETWPADDLLVGLFLHKTNGRFRFVELPNALAYDLASDWNLNAYGHVANPKQGINPHKLKTDAQYLDVATAYESVFAPT